MELNIEQLGSVFPSSPFSSHTLVFFSLTVTMPLTRWIFVFPSPALRVSLPLLPVKCLLALIHPPPPILSALFPLTSILLLFVKMYPCCLNLFKDQMFTVTRDSPGYCCRWKDGLPNHCAILTLANKVERWSLLIPDFVFAGYFKRLPGDLTKTWSTSSCWIDLGFPFAVS